MDEELTRDDWERIHRLNFSALEKLKELHPNQTIDPEIVRLVHQEVMKNYLQWRKDVLEGKIKWWPKES